MLSPYRLVGAIVALAFLCVTHALSLQRSVAQDKRDCPSLFAAVLTIPENFERRQEIRSMWTTAGSAYANHLQYKFAFCTADGVSRELKAELDKYDDMVFMDCEEGYLDGILTRKVATSMQYYLNNFPKFELYMKIDDDAYLSTDRLCTFMDEKMKNGTDINKAYIGVFAEGNEKENATHPVIRDETNPWYEPYSKYPDENYPVSAKGGPGYILPRASVQEIIDTNISSDYELNNEDKAVGYWVTKLKTAKIEHYVNLPGTDGYEEHKEFNYRHNCTRGPFGGYPLLVHHHLEGPAIACMHEIEFAKDPDMTIDECFQLNLFSYPAKEHVRIHMPYCVPVDSCYPAKEHVGTV